MAANFHRQRGTPIGPLFCSFLLTQNGQTSYLRDGFSRSFPELFGEISRDLPRRHLRQHRLRASLLAIFGPACRRRCSRLARNCSHPPPPTESARKRSTARDRFPEQIQWGEGGEASGALILGASNSRHWETDCNAKNCSRFYATGCAICDH